MKTILFYILFLSFFLVACAQKGNHATDKNRNIALDTISLIQDQKFENGILLQGGNSEHPLTDKFIYPFGKSKFKPSWILSEWHSKYLLSQADFEEKKGEKIYENKGKRISFKHERNSTLVRMDMKTSAEYSHPRKAHEGWPHLLLEQRFSKRPLLKNIISLNLRFEGRLLYSKIEMPIADFDSVLHSAQFQLFIVVKNTNKLSDDYEDFLWFGIPFYDYRYKEIPVYASKDIGKEDATGKFIYSISNTAYMEGSFQDKEWKNIDVNLKPFIRKALFVAKGKGFLKESKLSDFSMVGMNLGWEIPGTFNVAFEFKNFDIKCVLKN